MVKRVEDPYELLERGSREHYDDATYYDYTYRSLRADVEFYRRRARKSGGPILELGVGTGRVAMALADDGHEVVGVDMSPVMLERARLRAKMLTRGKVTLREGDIRSFRLRKRFPLIVSPFNVLLHLYEPDDFAQCFECVARHLAPGGRFVFDVRVPDPRELARDPDRVYVGRPFVHPSLGCKVRYTEQFRYDPIKQVQHVTIRFVPEKRGVKPVETLLTQRQIFPAELRGLLRLGGLQLKARYGDFSGRPLAPGDSLEVVEAARIGDTA
jgi:SAM-dependent methyltransferase